MTLLKIKVYIHKTFNIYLKSLRVMVPYYFGYRKIVLKLLRGEGKTTYAFSVMLR